MPQIVEPEPLDAREPHGPQEHPPDVLAGAAVLAAEHVLPPRARRQGHLVGLLLLGLGEVDVAVLQVHVPPAHAHDLGEAPARVEREGDKLLNRWAAVGQQGTDLIGPSGFTGSSFQSAALLRIRLRQATSRLTVALDTVLVFAAVHALILTSRSASLILATAWPLKGCWRPS